MHRLAIIDVGTHSILLLIAETNINGNIVPIHQEIRSVRLGKSVDRDGIIRNEPLTETILVLNRFKDLAMNRKAERIVVVGTQVLRSAKNRDFVRATIKQKTGLDIETLHQKDEARWSYRGAIDDRNIDGPTIVLDIGGGSTELILGDGQKILDFTSIGIGAVGLTERFIQQDPPAENEYASMEDYIRSALKDTISSILKQGVTLIGVGGTVTTLAALHRGMKRYDPDSIDGYIMRFSAIDKILNKMKRLPLSSRKKLLELDPERADILPAGASILLTILSLGKFKDILVSDRGLRFGIALREFGNA